jgi:hypothetical protein
MDEIGCAGAIRSSLLDRSELQALAATTTVQTASLEHLHSVLELIAKQLPDAVHHRGRSDGAAADLTTGNRSLVEGDTTCSQATRVDEAEYRDCSALDFRALGNALAAVDACLGVERDRDDSIFIRFT